MPTAQKIINSALRKLGALGVGESPNAQESGECLTSLNQMLETWRGERLMSYAVQTVTKAITASTSAVTIGSGAQWNIERPVKLVNASWQVGGVNYPLDATTTWEEFQSYATNTTGAPEAVYYEAAYPLGILHIAPIPSADGTLVLGIPTVLEAFASLSDDNSLPPGYERAYAYNLALELAPEYQLTPSDLVKETARTAKTILKRNALVINELRADPGLPGTSGHFDISQG